MMSSTFISADDLAKQLNDVVVFDCRFSLANSNLGVDSFKQGHIPSSSHLNMETDLAGYKTGKNGRHPLPTKGDFESRLRQSGVSNNTRIVLYDDNKLAGAARAWWLLNFFGQSNVKILNGGIKSWVASGNELAKGDVSKVQRGDISLAPENTNMLIDLETMKSTSENSEQVVVDSREAERFAGKHEPIDPVAGRIPGAINVPWGSVTDEQGMIHDVETQRQRWPRESFDDEPIIYCGSGVTACVNLISRELAGLPMGKMYLGGWSEWCNQDDTIIERD